MPRDSAFVNFRATSRDNEIRTRSRILCAAGRREEWRGWNEDGKKERGNYLRGSEARISERFADTGLTSGIFIK